MYVFKINKIAQIHLNKTGGTSLRAYLEVATGEKAIIFEGKHNTLPDALRIRDETHRLIALIRNPYDRLVSLKAYRKDRYLRGERGHSEHRLRAAHDLSFGEWLRRDLLPNTTVGSPMDQPLSHLLGFPQRPPVWVSILRLEELCTEGPAFLESLGITAPTFSQHLNVSSRGHWSEYYDRESLELVYRWDQRVFDDYYADLVP